MFIETHVGRHRKTEWLRNPTASNAIVLPLPSPKSLLHIAAGKFIHATLLREHTTVVIILNFKSGMYDTHDVRSFHLLVSSAGYFLQDFVQPRIC